MHTDLITKYTYSACVCVLSYMASIRECYYPATSFRHTPGGLGRHRGLGFRIGFGNVKHKQNAEHADFGGDSDKRPTRTYTYFL